MKAMVIYDSQFGNTAKIAQAIADGLGSADEKQDKVVLTRIGDANPVQLAGLDLLVVGSPTQKFRPTSATSDFLKQIPKNGLEGMRVAAFDTRITEEEIEANRFLSKMVDIFGYAAEPISDRLEKKGGVVAMPPEGFYVSGTEGPLLDGELKRATEWGKRIVTRQ